MNLTDRASMSIKVRETEFRPLLDPQRVTAYIKQHLLPWTDLIRDITNYGSNLIPRCFGSSGRSLKDAVVIGILLRQVVAMLDSAAILLSNGAVHAAQLQLRALFEASVYIDWILEGDSERKAVYYYVHNLRRKRLWAGRVQPGSTESKEFLDMMNEAGVQITEQTKEAARKQLQDIMRVLAQPALSRANNDFDNYRKGKRYDPAWYAPLGQRSLGTMARAVGKRTLYTILYSGASEVMHTSNYEHHLKMGKGEVTFQPIRSVEGFENVFRYTLNIALMTFRKILAEYRNDELPAFSRKYMENWKSEFINFPRFTIKTDSTRI
jgi:hypothetical protein